MAALPGVPTTGAIRYEGLQAIVDGISGIIDTKIAETMGTLTSDVTAAEARLKSDIAQMVTTGEIGDQIRANVEAQVTKLNDDNTTSLLVQVRKTSAGECVDRFNAFQHVLKAQVDALAARELVPDVRLAVARPHGVQVEELVQPLHGHQIAVAEEQLRVRRAVGRRRRRVAAAAKALLEPHLEEAPALVGRAAKRERHDGGLAVEAVEETACKAVSR